MPRSSSRMPPLYYDTHDSTAYVGFDKSLKDLPNYFFYDGVADPAVIIEVAMVYLDTLGGGVLRTYGLGETWTIQTTINIPGSNITWISDRSLIIKASAALAGNLIAATSVNNIVFDSIYLDGTRATCVANGFTLTTCYDVVIKNCVLYNIGATGVHCTDALRLDFHGNEVLTTTDCGIRVWTGGDNARIYDNYFYNCGLTGTDNSVHVRGSDYVITCDNVIDTVSDTGIEYEAYNNGNTCNNGVLVGNIIYNCGINGILVGCTGVATPVCHDTVVVGNAIYNSVTGGIYIRSMVAGIYVDNTIVSGNTINTVTTAGSGMGITLLRVEWTTVTGNNISNCGGDGININTATVNGNLIGNNTIYDIDRQGIDASNADRLTIVGNIIERTLNDGILLTSCDYATVSSNNIYQVSYTTANYDGIKLDTDSSNCMVFGNTVNDSGRYGINIDDVGCVGNWVFNNKLVACDTAIFNDAGVGTVLQTVRASFVKELGTAAWIVALAAPQGIDIDAANEGALAKIALPLDLQQIVRIKIKGTAQVAETHGMQLDLECLAGIDNESHATGEVISVVKTSSTLNFANLDGVTWSFSSADNADIGHLTSGDVLQINALYSAISGDNCATDLLLVGEEVEISYV